MNITNLSSAVKLIGQDTSFVSKSWKNTALCVTALSIFLLAIVPGRRYKTPPVISFMMYGPVLLIAFRSLNVFYVTIFQIYIMMMFAFSVLHETIVDNSALWQFILSNVASICFAVKAKAFLTLITLICISIRTLLIRWEIPAGNKGEYTMCNEVFGFEDSAMKNSIKRRIMRDCYARNIYKARGNIFTSPLKQLYDGGNCTKYALDQAVRLAENHPAEQLEQASALQLGRLMATWWCLFISGFLFTGITQDNIFAYLSVSTAITYIIGTSRFAGAGISVPIIDLYKAKRKNENKALTYARAIVATFAIPGALAQSIMTNVSDWNVTRGRSNLGLEGIIAIALLAEQDGDDSHTRIGNKIFNNMTANDRRTYLAVVRANIQKDDNYNYIESMNIKNKAQRSVGDSNLMHKTIKSSRTFLINLATMISAAKDLIGRDDITLQVHPSGAVRAALEVLYLICVRMCDADPNILVTGIEELPPNFSIPVHKYYSFIKQYGNGFSKQEIRNAAHAATGDDAAALSALEPVVQFEENVYGHDYSNSIKARLMYNICMLQCAHVVGLIATSNVSQSGPAAKVIIQCSILVNKRLGHKAEVKHLEKTMQDVENAELRLEIV